MDRAENCNLKWLSTCQQFVVVSGKLCNFITGRNEREETTVLKIQYQEETTVLKIQYQKCCVCGETFRRSFAVAGLHRPKTSRYLLVFRRILKMIMTMSGRPVHVLASELQASIRRRQQRFVEFVEIFKSYFCFVIDVSCPVSGMPCTKACSCIANAIFHSHVCFRAQNSHAKPMCLFLMISRQKNSGEYRK